MRDVGLGSVFSCFSLAYELRHRGLLGRSAELQRLLDLEVRCRLAASRGNLRLQFGLPNAGSVELTLQHGEPVDLGLRGVEQGGRPLQAGLHILGGVRIDEDCDGQQIGLLLVLVTDQLSGFGLLGVQSSLSGGDGGDCRGEVGPSLPQPDGHLRVLYLRLP